MLLEREVSGRACYSLQTWQNDLLILAIEYTLKQFKTNWSYDSKESHGIFFLLVYDALIFGICFCF